MRSWGPWEWIAYACLLVGAVIVAADAGLKQSPTVTTQLPDFIHTEWWAFTPVSFVLLATIILLFREFGSSKRLVRQEAKPLPFQDAVKSSAPTISERVFVGGTVTPRYLVSFFDDHTAMQATMMAKPFIGKWIRLSGTVGNVQSSDTGGSITLQPDRSDLLFS